jgi:hypothetical protein
MLNLHDIITTSIPLLPSSTIFIKARTVQSIGKVSTLTPYLRSILDSVYRRRGKGKGRKEEPGKNQEAINR